MAAAAEAVANAKSLRAPPPSPMCIQPQQEIALHPPPQKLHHLHKVPLKPCVIPTPPQIHQRESLSDVQTLMHQGVTTMAKKSPVHQFSQNAQVHYPHNHHEIKL
ncbi:neuroligin-4, X-linked [Nephila pilipes]|uniref:Neuroligin-4, X-linked n=1 Tax=Nephila pilipes TaxID=299642 RepID=A0A8X6U3Z4_NEPPI|nr:neuroligin-4, X-linked [Nephila pilipes]